MVHAQGPGGLPASNPNEFSVRDVCAAAVPREAQGNQFEWSPDSGGIAYFKPLEGGFGLRQELDLSAMPDGQNTTLVTQKQLDLLFPATLVGAQQSLTPPPRKSVGFEWASDGSGLLLHSDRGIVWLDRKTLQTRSLISGKDLIGDVQLSPDGRWAAFVRDHNLWVVATAGGAARAITRGGTDTLRKGELDWLYPTELGTKHAYAWSPDSSRIAYLEFDLKGVATYTPPFTRDGDPSRTIDYPPPGTYNPAVKVFVAGLNEKAIVAIDTGKAADVYLPRMQWLPDSKQVAVERLNRLQTQLELLIADARSGASRVVVTDTDRYWINLTGTLYFLRGSAQFIWSSERSGYRHLYLYGLDGKLVTQLTDGKWEVSLLDAVDERSRKFYFTSTETSSLERQLYVSSLDGKGEVRLSVESGTHEASFSPDASTYVDNFSTAVKPWARSVYRVPAQTGASVPAQPGARTPSTRLFVLDAPPAAARRPVSQLVNFVTVKTHDGVDMNALLIRPATIAGEKKYPAIVYVDGGPGSQAVRDAWDGDVSVWRQLLVQHGYVVFAADNRGTAGRGHIFEEYIHLRFEAQEMTDQSDALHFLQSLPYVDPARIGIWGRGFGGALTVRSMLHSPVSFKAGFAIAPVINWLRYDSAFTERYLGDTVSNQDGYLSSSALGEWRSYKGPMLVAQGLDDLKVHPDQTMELQESLVEKRKFAEISLFPGQSHLIEKPDACEVMYQRATDFFAGSL